MSHNHENGCCYKPTTAAQSLDEMDFERGIWNAGESTLYKYNYTWPILTSKFLKF